MIPFVLMSFKMVAFRFLATWLVFIVVGAFGSAKLPSFPSFLKKIYNSSEDNEPPRSFLIQQVPGDGGCLFHSVATCINHRTIGKHSEFNSITQFLSDKLRCLSVSMLRSNASLKIEGNETIPTNELVAAMAAHYNMTALDYISAMEKPETWGGGPEIVALCNHFKIPIHVYKLLANKTTEDFDLKLMARFGSPAFDSNKPICLLCADGRFPNVCVGYEKKDGDHFLALFPVEESENIDTERGETAEKCVKTTCPAVRKLYQPSLFSRFMSYFFPKTTQ